MSKKLTAQEFIANSRKVHGFRFDWAKNNGYTLLRIPYTEIKSINQILTNFLLKESNVVNS